MRWRRVAVRGPSMSPALTDGDVVLVTLGARPRPGDVVLVRWPARPGQLSVKRAGRPDGGATAGAGATAGVDTGGGGAEDGPYWLVRGDNPFGSTDSRELGPAAVLGVVRFRLWPRPGRLPRKPVADGDAV
ncbi:MAG TPA: S26 family signal peptidase [Pseudonocardia sp.]|nr:S26 family signal peptidase [Pseudonocardia sp.]